MKVSNAEKPFISVAKFAVESGFSRTTVTQAVKAGHIPSLLFNKRRVISRDWLRSWMESAAKTCISADSNRAS